MGWMKAIYTDVEELNEAVLDLYSENQITAPGDAIDPLSDYLYKAGWKSPTEMLAMKRDMTAAVQRIVSAPTELHELLAEGDLAMVVMEAFNITHTDLRVDEPVPA